MKIIRKAAEHQYNRDPHLPDLGEGLAKQRARGGVLNNYSPLSQLRRMCPFRSGSLLFSLLEDDTENIRVLSAVVS